MQTHGNLVFNAGTVRSVMRVTAEDRTLVVAPMFHATGIASQLVGFGAQGAACVFQPRFRPADMLGALIEHRITFFAGVTAMIQLMLVDLAFDQADLPALRAACFGGAPVAEAFLDDVVRRMPDLTFMNVWGLTEATSIVTCAIGSRWRERPWSVGRPVPGVEVAVAVDGQVADAPDAVGELWVRGPVVTAGYWNRPDPDTFRSDGWLRTGDVGRADAGGYVQVLDRLKDMIIRGGENIYSLEVEGVLARHPAIAEVAVVGVPDPVMGERVGAVAVPHTGRSLALGALREWAGAWLADYKLPAEAGHPQRAAPQRQRQGHQEATGRAASRATGWNPVAERTRENLMHTGWMPHQEQAARPDRAPAGPVHVRCHPRLGRRAVLPPRLPRHRDPRARRLGGAVHFHALPLLRDQAGHSLRGHRQVPARVRGHAGDRPARHVGAAAGQARAGRDRSRGPDRDPP